MKKLFVLFVALALVGFTVPAVAADWSFYGSARMETFWDDIDGGDAGADDEELTWTAPGNARIGARVKGDTLNGRFEMSTSFGLRLLNATWNFGAGSILLGQDYTPYSQFISDQWWGSNNGLLNVGGMYASRRQQIKLMFGGFQVALIDVTGESALGITAGDTDVSLPKLEAKYSYSSDMFSVAVSGGYQTYEIENPVKNVDVDSFAVGVGGSVNFGPVTIKGDVFTGQNLGPYGMYNAGNDDPGISATGSVIDNESFGFLAVVRFKASDMLSFEGGFGKVVNELDVSGSNEDDTAAWYVQANITLAPGFFIVPEVGIFDNGENGAGVDEGDHTYFGAAWVMNF